MIPFIFHILRLLFSFISPSDAKERNLIYAAFEENYESKNCESALMQFENLKQEDLPISVEIRLKVVDCYYQLKDTARQKKELNYLSYVHNPTQKSTILNQKAMLAAYLGDTLGAINYLKMAIETENTNNFAKRNYELLKKVYNPNQNRTPPPPQSSSNNNSLENQGGIVAKSNEKEDELTSSDPPAIERAQALKLLDAMRANEYNKLPMLLDVTSDTLDYGNW